MDKEMQEMLQTILSGMEGMEKRFHAKVEDEIRGVKVLLEKNVEKLKLRLERLEARAG